MDSTRRTFLTSAGAVAAQNVADAQDHEHDHQAIPSDPALRVKALESLLVEKGYVDSAALDALMTGSSTKWVRAMARVWLREPGWIPRTRSACWPTPPRLLGSWLHERAGRTYAGSRKRTQGPQPGGMHALLVLSMAATGPAAGLVQVRGVPIARGNRPARGTPGVWDTGR